MAGNLTLAMIKPHTVMERKVGQIFTRIEDASFGIILGKLVQIRPEGVDVFYEEHKNKEFFNKLKHYTCVGPVWALVLFKDNAVEEWKKLVGATNPAKAEPETIRAEFGRPDNMTMNAVHGSATDHDAKREINFFFAREIKMAEVLDAPNNQPGL